MIGRHRVFRLATYSYVFWRGVLGVGMMYLGCVCFFVGVCLLFGVGRAASDTSPEKNYAVEIPPKEYSPGITALQGLAQCKSLLPLGSPIILTTGKPPPGKYASLLLDCYFSSHEHNKIHTWYKNHDQCFIFLRHQPAPDPASDRFCQLVFVCFLFA